MRLPADGDSIRSPASRRHFTAGRDRLQVPFSESPSFPSGVWERGKWRTRHACRRQSSSLGGGGSTKAFVHEEHEGPRSQANGPRPWFLSDFRSSEPLRKPREALNRAHTGREQAICGFKGVGDFEGFHLLHQPYLLNRIKLMHKQSRFRAQMLLTAMTAKTGRKALENTKNGPKAVNLRVKSACSEVFFASKGPLLRTEARLGGLVLYTLERSLK